jgi:hypothetical protein
MSVIQDVWEQRKTIVDSLVGGLNDLADVAETIKTNFETIDDGVGDRITGYARSLQRYYDNIMSFWNTLWNENEVVNACKMILTPVVECLPSDIKFDENGYPMVLDAAKELAINLGDRFIKKIPELFPDLATPDPDRGDKPLSGKSWVGDLVHKLDDYIPPSINNMIPQAWKDTFACVAEGAVNKGLDKGQELLNKGFDIVGNKLETLISGKFGVDISPFVELGKNKLNEVFGMGRTKVIGYDKSSGMKSKVGGPDIDTLAPIDYSLANWQTVKCWTQFIYPNTQTDEDRERVNTITFSTYIYRNIGYCCITVGDGSFNSITPFWFNNSMAYRVLVDDLGGVFGDTAIDFRDYSFPVLCDVGSGYCFATRMYVTLADETRYQLVLENPFPNNGEGMLLLANHVSYSFGVPIGGFVDGEGRTSNPATMNWFSYVKGETERIAHTSVYTLIKVRTANTTTNFGRPGNKLKNLVVYGGDALPDASLEGYSTLAFFSPRNLDLGTYGSPGVILTITENNKMSFLLQDDYPFETTEEGERMAPNVSLTSDFFTPMFILSSGEQVYFRESFECFEFMRVIKTDGFIQYEFCFNPKMQVPPAGKLRVLPAGEIPMCYCPSKHLIIPVMGATYLTIQTDGCVTLHMAEAEGTFFAYGQPGLIFSTMFPSFSVITLTEKHNPGIDELRAIVPGREKLFKILEDTGNLIYEWQGTSIGDFQIDYKDGVAVACIYDLTNLRRPLHGPLSAGEGPEINTREQIEEMITNLNNIRIKLADGSIVRPIAIIENKTESYTGDILTGCFNFYCVVCDFVWSWSIIKWITDNAKRIRDNVKALITEWKGKSFIDYFHAIKNHLDDIIGIVKVIMGLVERMRNEIQAGTLISTATDYVKTQASAFYNTYGLSAIGQGTAYVREKFNEYAAKGTEYALNMGTELLKEQIAVYSSKISGKQIPILSNAVDVINEAGYADAMVDMARGKLDELSQTGINKANKIADKGIGKLLDLIVPN